MAVLTTTWKAEFTGDGSTTTFLCAFPLMDTGDLEVYIDDVLKRASRDYTLSGVVYTDRHTVADGFSVVMKEAPATGAEVYLRRRTPRENQTMLHGGDKFSLPVFENSYDRLVMIYQELGGLILEGFQGPIPEFATNRDYEPQSSGFFAAKVVSAPTSGLYELQAAIPAGGGWTTTSLPILTSQGAEINGRTNVSVGDTVLVLPIADTQGQDGWRFVASSPCGGTAYTGNFYVITRCDQTDVDEVAWVRADEFSVGDSFVLGGVCYVVKTGAVTDIAPELTIRLADVTAYADCDACTTANPPVPSDPDFDNPPFPGNLFRDMARCSDDDTSEYSLPIEYFGIPTNQDLTKAYELDDVCYYVAEGETATPNNPLFPTHRAGTADDCLSCGCNSSVTTCTHCSAGATPSEYAVTFSNILPCENCDGSQLMVFKAGKGLGDLNKSHTLSQESNCSWRLIVPDLFTFDNVAEECGASGGTHYDVDLRITLSKSGTTWTLSGELFTSFPASRGEVFWAQAEETAVDVCGEVPAFTNGLQALNGDVCLDLYAGGSGLKSRGVNGAATVVCV